MAVISNRKSVRNDLSDNIGKLVRKARMNKGVTQAEMANSLGLSRKAYCAYETGASRFPAWVLLEVSKQLELPVDKIISMEWTENPADRSKTEILNEIENFLMQLSRDQLQEIKMALTVQRLEKTSQQNEWEQIGAEIAQKVNGSGQKLIKDFIEMISSNPEFSAENPEK